MTVRKRFRILWWNVAACLTTSVLFVWFILHMLNGMGALTETVTP